MAKRFSIITVHRNGIERLRNFLSSAEQVIDNNLDSIMVVDNHSLDGSIAIAKKDIARSARTAERGFLSKMRSVR